MTRAWLVALLALASAGVSARDGESNAATGGGLAVTACTVDGGGGRSAGASYVITGSVGQPDAEPLQPSTGGGFSIVGGFVPAARATQPGVDALFANGFEG